MHTTTTANLLRYFSPLRLAGPMFDKELRVATRRRRLYLLRFAYVAVLAMVILQMWYSGLRSGRSGSAVLQVSRLSEMGKAIVGTVVWFQFITGQILTAVLLSDAIGSEIRHRTLDVLLVTPVRSFQIVIGKLASKLLQALSFLAISLPMLAVVRVFGGVPWDYVLAGLCITLSAGVFCGSLSLLLSITSRHPLNPVMAVGLWYLVIWGLVPVVLTALAGAGYAGTTVVMGVLRLTNPLVVLGGLTQTMAVGYSSSGVGVALLLHCLTLLGLSAVLLVWSVWRVRKVALRMTSARSAETPDEAVAGKARRTGRRAIRPVTGSPIVWKEGCTPLFKTWGQRLFLIAILIIVPGVVIAIALVERKALYPITLLLTQAMQLLFVIDVAVAAAGAITKEREARTWPILLTTPLEPGEIIRGKAIGVIRRNLPFLLPLPVLYLVMLLSNPSDQSVALPAAVGAGMVILSLVGTVFFLLGVGLYFSTRLKTTTAAVAATFAAYVAPKFLFCGFLSPVFILSTGMLGAARGRNGFFSLPMLAISISPAVVYIGIGLLFMSLASRRVRRDIF